MNAHSDVTIELDGLTVGPGQWLVLCAQHPLSLDAVQRIKGRMPEALRDRVLVVDQMTGYVVEMPDA